MKLNMKVTFDRSDLEEILKEEYVRRFGEIKPGFELSASGSYDTWTVEMSEKEIEEPVVKAESPMGATSPVVKV